MRNSPEDIGQLRDGAASREEFEAHFPETRREDSWTAKEALRGRLTGLDTSAHRPQVFDTQGTYEPAFIGLAVLTLAGSLTALVLQAPKRVVGVH